MNTKDATSKPGFFKTLTTIYYALLAGQIFFALMCYYLVHEPAQPISASMFRILQFIALGWLLGGGITAQIIYKKHVKKASLSKTTEVKTKLYSTATIIRLALLESITLYLLVAFFITADQIFIIMALLNIMFFLLYRPTKTRIEGELKLSKKEKELIL